MSCKGLLDFLGHPDKRTVIQPGGNKGMDELFSGILGKDRPDFFSIHCKILQFAHFAILATQNMVSFKFKKSALTLAVVSIVLFIHVGGKFDFILASA